MATVATLSIMERHRGEFSISSAHGSARDPIDAASTTTSTSLPTVSSITSDAWSSWSSSGSERKQGSPSTMINGW